MSLAPFGHELRNVTELGRDGFTLHAAPHVRGAEGAGREALLKYVLRPPLAHKRLFSAKNVH